MVGIKETKELVELALAGAKAVKDSLDDGKMGFEDLVNIMTIVPAVGPAIDSIDQIPAELGDMDATEVAEVLALVRAKMPEITDDARAQDIAAASLNAGLAVARLVASIRS